MTWGAAEFVAAEEMGRPRGFWWAPDGRSLLAARVDNSPRHQTVDVGPVGAGQQTAAPLLSPCRYRRLGRQPLAPRGISRRGPAHAGPVGRRALPVPRRRPLEPLGPPLLLVEQRDHQACAVLSVDLAEGLTSRLAEASDAAWVWSPPGVPAWLEDGQLLWAVADADTCRLKVGDELVTPPGLQVRGVTHAGTLGPVHGVERPLRW